jgi:predicted acetyltransferase
VLYAQLERPHAHLRVFEIIANRPEAYRGLLEFLGAHHLWDKVDFAGGGDVPWLSLIVNPHQVEAHVETPQQVLVRIADLASAIRARPVPSYCPVADVRLRVRDAAGRGSEWVCEASGGDTVDAEIDSATLSSLFLGFMSTRQARDVGGLKTSDTAVPTLGALLHTAYPPHFGDHF